MKLKFQSLKNPFHIEIWGAKYKEWTFAIVKGRMGEISASYRKMDDDADVQCIGDLFQNVDSAIEACEQTANQL